MKKIFYIMGLIFLLICIGIGFILFKKLEFNRNLELESKNLVDENKRVFSVNDDRENDKESLNLEENQKFEEKEVEIQSEEESKVENAIKNKSNEVKKEKNKLNNNSEQIIKKEQPKKEVVKPKEEPKKEPNKTKIESNDNKNTSVEDKIPAQQEVDIEYENLMKQVEYKTYEECMNAGFEIALKDTVNILGFDPIEVIYKGKVLGYKLKINYSNPMEN